MDFQFQLGFSSAVKLVLVSRGVTVDPISENQYFIISLLNKQRVNTKHIS